MQVGIEYRQRGCALRKRAARGGGKQRRGSDAAKKTGCTEHARIGAKKRQCRTAPLPAQATRCARLSGRHGIRRQGTNRGTFGRDAEAQRLGAARMRKAADSPAARTVPLRVRHTG